MSKVLITGGTGFIGLHLSRKIAEEGHELYIVDNFAREYSGDAELKEVIERENVTLVRGDITDPGLFVELDNDFDQVYHLAAINGTGNFYEIPDQVLRVGVLGTLNLLEWLKSNPQAKIVFSSSSEAYAGTLSLLGNDFPVPTPENVPLVIDDVANPRWSYAAGKMVSEVALNCYAQAHGLTNFSIIRYHNVYGPRMGFKHVVPQMIERIVKKEFPFKVFGADESRAFCYVDDAVKATQLVMESAKTCGEIYHIGKQEEISIEALAKKLLLITGSPTDTLAEASFQGSVKRRCPDVTKLEELGYEASVSLDEGLKACYDWYKNKF